MNGIKALAAIAIAAASALAATAHAEVKTLRVGYSYITPTSVILKEKGWLEQQLQPRGVKVEWILTRGSNQTLEFLRGRVIDVGNSAGSAALLARANGTPVKVIFWMTRGESTALVTLPNSPIKTIADLKGRKIAATRGTEPLIFLLRALKKNGLSEKDVEIVALQHPEGRVALEAGRVDAWAGLDPDLSIVELKRNALFFYRDEGLITGGVQDVREDFAKENPELVRLISDGNEWALQYIAEHREEAIALFAQYAKLEPDVARRAFERNDFAHPQITDDDFRNIEGSGEVLKVQGLIPADTDLKKVTQELLDPSSYPKAHTH